MLGEQLGEAVGIVAGVGVLSAENGSYRWRAWEWTGAAG